MAQPRQARTPRPLDRSTLEALALHYAGRYATTEARLAGYLKRKLRERGWADPGVPPVDAVVARLVELRYVDDAAFADARVQSLIRRGYGPRRVALALGAAGIARSLAEDVAPDRDAARAAAESFARRRRFGPFSDGMVGPDLRRRQIAAMMRAGHDYELARYFTDPARSDAIDA